MLVEYVESLALFKNTPEKTNMAARNGIAGVEERLVKVTATEFSAVASSK